MTTPAGPSAAEKSVANRVEELTITGGATDVSDPTDELKLNVKELPGCRTGEGSPVDVTQSTALTAWPAANRFGVTLNAMPTFVCASALGVRKIPPGARSANSMAVTMTLASRAFLTIAA